MKNILIFGAGRSSTAMIDYLGERAEARDWNITVVDANLEAAQSKTAPYARATPRQLDIFDEGLRRELITNHDLVVSLLPVTLHDLVAGDCLDIGRHLCTASYVNPSMEEKARQARLKGLVFMGELGLDPGLDHMSAMECIEDLREAGAEITAFRSYTGGLVAPESDDNPWHYKISWNPRNVVLAGQGTSTFLFNRKIKHIPYHQLFHRRVVIDVEDLGMYETYINRDSISYSSIYGIDDIPTIIRGTIRHMGFCQAWHALVHLGWTDDTYIIKQAKKLSFRQLLGAYLPDGPGNLEQRLSEYLKIPIDGKVMEKLKFLGLFSSEKIPLENASIARILEELIKTKWLLKPNDKDMIIMQHEINYVKDNEEKKLVSTLIQKGEDAVHTAMSKLVGVPLAVFVDLVLTGKITAVSKSRPVEPHVFRPILEELKAHDIKFKQTIREV